MGFLLLVLVSAHALHCEVGSTLGCFNDSVSHPVPHLVTTTDPHMTLESCMVACVANGYKILAATGRGGSTPVGYCYCGNSLQPAHPVAASLCDLPCPGNHTERCGGSGFSLAVATVCDGPLPPSPFGPPLPAGPACSQEAARAFSFCNTSLSLNDRVDDLVDRLTLAEAGHLLTARESPAIARLGLPEFYWGTNNIHGVRIDACSDGGRCPTSYPNGVAMGATFNMSLAFELGRTTGVEMRAFFNIQSKAANNHYKVGLTSWGPTINVMRDPRWGRNQEAVSEDPYLSGQYGASVARGMQTGEDARYLRASTGLKHFTAYSLEDYDHHRWTRQTFNAVVDPYDLADTYTPAWEAAIREGGATGVMTACNMLNGVPSPASPVLRRLLDKWNFDGYRTTDGNGIRQMVSSQKYAANLQDAIVAAVDGRTDIDDGSAYSSALAAAVVGGAVDFEKVKQLLKDTMRIRFRLGDMNPGADQPYRKLGEEDIADARSRASNTLAARECLVLLKNDNKTLPFPKSGDTVAVIGPNANSTKLLQGNYGGWFCPHGSSACFPSVRQAIERHAGVGSVVYAPGCSIDSGSAAERDAAVQAARSANRVVLVLGLDQTLEGEQHDRFNITLPLVQQELAAAVLAVGRPTAVVLIHGGAIALDGIVDLMPAIIDAHYPGVTGGLAIADALFGDLNPGGKLPYTVYPTSFQHASNFTSMSMTEPPGRTYRYYTGTPLFSFGFGLSYTTFMLEWSAPVRQDVQLTAPVVLSVTVSNTGHVQGDEVVQAYFRPLFQRSPAPLRQLFSFKRVSVAPGHAETIELVTVTSQSFLLVNSNGTRVSVPGRYEVMVTRGHGTALTRVFVVE